MGLRRATEELQEPKPSNTAAATANVVAAAWMIRTTEGDRGAYGTLYTSSESVEVRLEGRVVFWAPRERVIHVERKNLK